MFDKKRFSNILCIHRKINHFAKQLKKRGENGE